MPIAIEIFELPAESGTFRIDINGAPWGHVAAPDVPEKLAEIGRAYVHRRLADLLRAPPDSR